MNFRNLISVAGGWIVPLSVLGLGAVSAVMIYGKFKSGDISFGNTAMDLEIEQKEESLRALQKELSVAKKRLAERQQLEAKAEQFIAIQTELSNTREANLAARSKLDSLDEGLKQTEEMFGEYRQRYRNHIRAKAEGTKMDRLTTLDGKTYSQIEIKTVGALGMNITHSNGSCRIPYKELPLHMQRLYQFDDEEAEAQQKREAERRRKHQLALQASLLAGQDKSVGGDSQIAQGQQEERDRAADNLKAAIKNLRARISQAEANLRAEQGKTVSRAPQYRLELQQLNQALEENETRLRDLRAMR